MGIYRGVGGSISANTQAEIDDVTEAAVTATTKASEASTSAANAQASANTAQTHATTAATKASEATAAKDLAETAKTQAQTSATTATNKAIEASTSATNAANSATLAQDALEDINNLTATATTLPSGSSATASYDDETGVLTIGIPQGLQGIQGEQGEQGIQGERGEGAFTYTNTATSKTLVNQEKTLVTASGQTITLPASPSEGSAVGVVVENFTDTVVARNGSTIMELAEDLTLDKEYLSLDLVYQSGSWRFV